MRVSAGETARPRQIRKINLACLAACKTLGMLASELCEPKRADARAGRLEAYPDGAREPLSGRLRLWEEDWRRARCWGSTPAGTSAALPPLDPCSRSPLRRRSADKLLGNCKLSFLGPAHLSQASISAAQTQPKGKEEPSAASVHPHAVPGTASGDEEQPRRARARKQPTQATGRPGNTSDDADNTSDAERR